MPVYVTPEGLKKMQDELEELKNFKRPEIARRIGEAKEQGDLSENAEYQAARDEQSLIESRILELEEQLKIAIVVDHKSTGTVRIGSTVTVRQQNNDGKTHQRVFQIVGAHEADPVSGKISNASPVAHALLGHSAGESVTVNTPRGTVSYFIVSVS
jgi:transcription elongation factor GreA